MEIKIETDLNGKTHLVVYNNDDGTIIQTDTVENCKLALVDIIKGRHRITHFTFDGCDTVINHTENKIMKSKEFCGF